MKRLKIFATIFMAIAFIFVLRNISFGVGESQLVINRSYIENNPNRYCGDHDGGFPKPGESKYRGDITYNLVAQVHIDGGVATNLMNGSSTTAGNLDQVAANRVMYSILSGEYTGETGYGSLNNYTKTQLIFWGFLNTWLEQVSGSLGLDSRLVSGMDKVSNLYKDAGLGELYNRIMNEAALGSGGVVDIYIYMSANGNTSYQKVYEVVLGERPESGLTIDKVDAETGAFLANVDFIIQRITGEYILPDGTTTPDINVAKGNPHTTTGSSYNIQVPEGDYIVTEIANRNPEYDNTVMQRAAVTVSSTNPSLGKVVIKNAKIPEPDVPPAEGEGDGTVTISGYVWEDDFQGKGNSPDNIYGGGDAPVKDVTVKWYTSSGEYIKETKTDGSGYYKMTYISEYGNIVKSTKPFEYDKGVLDKLTNSYVVFEYNGVKYTTVATNTTEEKGSRGKESETDRVKVDSLFGDITKDSIQPSGLHLNIQKNTFDEYELQDDEKFKVGASTKGVLSNLLGTIEHDDKVNGHYKMTNSGAYKYGPGYSNMTDNNYMKNGSFYTKWCNNYGSYWRGTNANGSKGDWQQGPEAHKLGKIKYHKWITSGHMEPNPDYNGNGLQDDGDHWKDTSHWDDGSAEIWCNNQNAWKNPSTLIPAGYTQNGEIEWTNTYEVRDAENGNHSVEVKKTVAKDFYIKNVNLGLVRRETPDLALKSDINNVVITMKGQKYTYYYGKRGIQNINAPEVSFSDDGFVYTRPINPSDISYINDNNTNDMTIQIQYDIRVYNQSTTLQTVVSEIVNYYDSRYELASSGWTPSSKYGNSYSGNGYTAAYTSALSGTVLKPGASAGTSITFKVNDATVKSLITGEKQLFDVSEINTYSVLYGENTRCAEATTAASRNKTGTQYAGIDRDSIPGSAVPGNTGTYEDDTDKAPIFKLILDENKIVSGNVWEDTNVSRENERLGNGTKDGNENGVENVKVELLKAETGEVAKLYPTQGSTESVDAITYTDGSGNYNFNGVVVDNYIVKYTYGNDNINGGATKINGNEINARNYKSTIITTDPVKSVMTGDNETIMWHLTQQDNASVAVDDIEQRLKIPSLNYGNYNNPHNMSAYSPAFKIQVEYTESQQSEVDANGGSFPHEWTVFDFGIIERAREDIVIDKNISNLKITLANGQVLTEGDPRHDKLNYVKAIGTKVKSGKNSVVYDRDSYKKANDKLISVEMDSELLQGARLDITYAITVTNNSENDYEYDTNKGGGISYYYYGDKGSLPLIQPTVEKVVDYMDSELTCTVGNEATNDINKSNWTQIKPEIDNNTNKVTKTVAEVLQADSQLGSQISDVTKESLNNGNYLIFTTEAFNNVTSGGGSKTIEIFASKLLGNQAEDYTYENHVEILQLNGKIARTIDSTDNGKQVKKTYKSGNYVPSLDNLKNNDNIDKTEVGLHEQDDDRIIVKITPPTGSTNNIIIYTIALTAGLVIVAVGAYFIKKKIVL